MEKINLGWGEFLLIAKSLEDDNEFDVFFECVQQMKNLFRYASCLLPSKDRHTHPPNLRWDSYVQGTWKLRISILLLEVLFWIGHCFLGSKMNGKGNSNSISAGWKHNTLAILRLTQTLCPRT